MYSPHCYCGYICAPVVTSGICWIQLSLQTERILVLILFFEDMDIYFTLGLFDIKRSEC